MRAPPEIVDADHRRPDIHRLVHDLADLFGVRFAERAAEDGKVLAEHKDQPAIDRAVAGDDAVARDAVRVDAEIVAPMLDKHVPFFKGPWVEQQLEPLARSQLAATVLRFGPSDPAARPRRPALFLQPAENVVHFASQR